MTEAHNSGNGNGNGNGVRAGVWATLGDVRTALALERAGFGWMGVDAQHGHFDDAAVRGLFALRRDPSVPVLVRVAANDPTLIGRALDAGADGVVVPLVQDAEQAEAAVAAAHYPPRGARSWGPLPGARDAAAGVAAAPRPLCAVMVETAPAVAGVRAIAAVPDLDMVFVGPFDLALALGRDVDQLLADTAEDAPLPTIVRACREARVLAGAYAGSPQRAAALRAQGFSWIAVTTDAGVLQLGSDAALARPS
ncbi:HpcH/HpaI aldolase/citrate lyase family protein [Kocuria rhizosphaericola]|uniref:HpcH/HpaI aldolase family protein n=1 Tax=Kocuria rhizosphaericola TaxID=3376284 RepID=UPI0037A65AC9